MSRLYYKLYSMIFGALFLFILVAAAFWQFSDGWKWPREHLIERASELSSKGMLSADADPAIRRQFLEDIHAAYGVDVALFGADRRLIDGAGRSPLASHGDENDEYLYGGDTAALGIRLADGSWIEVGLVSPVSPLMFLSRMGVEVLIAILIAVVCYPVVRQATRRLERLQLSVMSLGSGDLSARVKVEGNDEVARLAQSFNRAAAQIEQLIEAHKLLLANVSHELRTPLSRLRLTAELLKGVADPKRRADLENDITEIDALIEHLLLSSRLDAIKTLEICEEVDLLALAAEEALRCSEHDVMGEPVVVRGDPTLLRRMVRNLIENAQLHGSPPVEVRVCRQNLYAVLTVNDGGSGIPASERERVFEPFYRVMGARTAGSGLGLSLVRQIARQHGGEAVVAGSATCPSVIKVRIPADHGNEVNSSP